MLVVFFGEKKDIDDKFANLTYEEKEQSHEIKVVEKSIQNNSPTSKSARPVGHIVDCQASVEKLLASMLSSPYEDPEYIRSRLDQSENSSAAFFNAISFIGKKTSTNDEGKAVGSSIPVLKDLIEREPENKLFGLYLLNQCLKDGNENECIPELLDAVAKRDSDNAMVWYLRAQMAAKLGDSEGVNDSLTKVILANDYRNYQVEAYGAYDEALLSIGVEDERHRFIYASGYWNAAVAYYLRPKELVEICSDNTVDNSELSEKCIAVGRHIRNIAKSSSDKSTGIQLLGAALSAEGNDLVLKEIENEGATEYQKNDVRNLQNLSNLMVFDSNIVRYYRSQREIVGESEALRHAEREAIRLSGNPEYEPCPI